MQARPRGPLTTEAILLQLVAERIFHTSHLAMTPNMKLQHYGLYCAITQITRDLNEPTTSNIAKFSGIHTVLVTKMANNLAKLGLVDREIVRATHGKGHQYLYRPIADVRKIHSLAGIDTPFDKPLESSKE
ncbi:hypothetical protein SAMN05519103_08496 [Rhizobiales bacterium GAS113]|nr:hypothetical protein SAMN05519103_08496 [Rhizobiales bacterium GAS113]